MVDESIELPPGFRFHPTDEEIITHYLIEKFANHSFTARAVAEVDLNKCEPWDLPNRAKMGEKEWYFFCQRDRKYPTGMRTNRATEAGYWKATGKDKEIYKGRNSLIGMKKTLVFYRGRAPKGEKTNWVMHEYRLEGKFSYQNRPNNTSKDEWVVCRVFHKNTGGVKKSPVMSAAGLLRMNSFEDQFFDPASFSTFSDPPSFVQTNTGRPTTTNHFSYGEADNKNAPIVSNNVFSNTNYYPNSHFGTVQGSSHSSGYPHMSMPGLDHSTMFTGLAVPNAAAYATTNTHCKVEQFSNQSMATLSQDTGLSTDITNEISSVASKHEMGGNRTYADFEVPSSSAAGGVVDLEDLWNY